MRLRGTRDCAEGNLPKGNVAMPLFEFRCEDCQSEIELLISRHAKAVCPKCKSTRMRKLLSTVSAGGVSKSSLSMLEGSCAPVSEGPCGPACCRLPE